MTQIRTTREPRIGADDREYDNRNNDNDNDNYNDNHNYNGNSGPRMTRMNADRTGQAESAKAPGPKKTFGVRGASREHQSQPPRQG